MPILFEARCLFCSQTSRLLCQRLNICGFVCFLLSLTINYSVFEQSLFGDELVHIPPFEEGHVEDRCICVHELQEESFQDQTLLKVGLRFRDLCRHMNEIIWD